MAQRKLFPKEVRSFMRAHESGATCVPVSFDGGDMEAAMFLSLAGPESKHDRRLLARWSGPLPIGLDTDVINTQYGSVVMLRPEVQLGPGEPLAFEILMTPGVGGTHFDALELLSKQPRLRWVFGDPDLRIMRMEQHPLQAEQHAEFERLRSEAFSQDTLVRLTGRYDANGALTEVVQHYASREP